MFEPAYWVCMGWPRLSGRGRFIPIRGGDVREIHHLGDGPCLLRVLASAGAIPRQLTRTISSSGTMSVQVRS